MQVGICAKVTYKRTQKRKQRYDTIETIVLILWIIVALFSAISCWFENVIVLVLGKNDQIISVPGLLGFGL